MEFFHAVFEHAKRIVLILVFYLTTSSSDVRGAVLLIQMIVVVTVLFPVPAYCYSVAPEYSGLWYRLLDCSLPGVPRYGMKSVQIKDVMLENA